ncbi:MAG: hypothetical protein OSB34_10260 [Planktomarina sp.]|nr:hypothetical protein [Planktomarina sp.]
MSLECAWCSAPRGSGLICDKCGVDYEKAAQIKAAGKASKKAEAVPRKSKKAERAELQQQRFVDAWQPVKEPELEYKLSIFVIPGMLALTFLMEIMGFGGGLLRIVFGMPVHEFGHALVGWFSGFNSIPTLWKTLIPEDRGFFAPVLLFASVCYLINFARLNRHGGLLLIGVLLLILQFIGTFVLDKSTAQVLVTWGGDGVGMMLAIVLMAGFNFDKHSNWYAGYLRWGFAFIGAAAFADIVSPWWVSLNDLSAVPYGASGGSHTDTYKLINYHGWTMDSVINRYVTLSVVCMFVLVPFYVRGIKHAARAMQMGRLSADTDLEADFEAKEGRDNL